MDSTVHILSGSQCSVIRNMVTERHNIASRMNLKVVSEGSYGSNLVHMDVGSADRLAQHDPQITEQVSNRATLPYLFDPCIADPARCNSSCLQVDADLTTPCPINPNRPLTTPLHRVLRSTRGNEEVKSTTPAGQLHELNVQNRHIHFIEIKYCGDAVITRIDNRAHVTVQACRRAVTSVAGDIWSVQKTAYLHMSWLDKKTSLSHYGMDSGDTSEQRLDELTMLV
eukprot:1156849-Pelagomonas_calceolata.AAC.4